MGPELVGVLALTLIVTAPPLASAAIPPCDPAPWTALLTVHGARYPRWSPTDAYKLLHQATLGSEHAIPDPGTAERWMTREVARLGSGPSEPLVDTLDAEGRFVRIHLRPWLQQQGDPRHLTAAFVTTANRAAPDTTALTCALRALVSFRGDSSSAWHTDSVTALIARQTASGHRAMDHSAGYVAAYHPAYRVIARELVAALIATTPAVR